MMPTSPPPPLKFRTSGFPQYGLKVSLSDRACPGAAEVKPLPACPPPSSGLPQPFARSTRTRPLGASRCVALSGKPEKSSPCATPLIPTGPLLRKGCTVPFIPATTARSASLAGTRVPSRLFTAYTADLRWAGAPEATRETFPALAASLSSIAVVYPRRETARLPAPNCLRRAPRPSRNPERLASPSPQSVLSTLSGSK